QELESCQIRGVNAQSRPDATLGVTQLHLRDSILAPDKKTFRSVLSARPCFLLLLNHLLLLRVRGGRHASREVELFVECHRGGAIPNGQAGTASGSVIVVLQGDDLILLPLVERQMLQSPVVRRVSALLESI